jgi:chaperonin GroES
MAIKEKQIIPRGKYMLVKQDEPESTENEFGLSIPDSSEQDQKAFGTIIAVGSEIKDIKEGDRVIFGAYAGEELEVKDGHKDIKYRLLYDEDVIAFIK